MSQDQDDEGALIDFYPYRDRFPSYHRLSPEGRDRTSILEELATMAGEEDRIADRGRVSGSIYHGDHDHYRFLTEAFRLFAHVNVLQRDMYPSATKLEAEIVAMTAAMLHGDAVPGHHPGEQVCGVVTFGGTESLINPMLVYRDRGRAEKGITEPEVIIPVTAHVALDKAAHLLGIKLLKAPLTDKWVADIAWIREHITENTVALVGSAANYAHGLIDPIEQLSEIALEHDLGLHVDGAALEAASSCRGASASAIAFRDSTSACQGSRRSPPTRTNTVTPSRARRCCCTGTATCASTSTSRSPIGLEESTSHPDCPAAAQVASWRRHGPRW
jgi:Glutamate decarboxylase and related PLP-dependent proteins